MVSKGKSHWIKTLKQILFVLAALFLINWLSSIYYVRWDWSSEKRYSLSDESKTLLKSVNDEIFFNVYLEGDFPAGFMRLKQKTKEMLNEFQAYNKNIRFRFINPNQEKDNNKRNQLYQELIDKGLTQTDLQVKTKDGLKQQLIFPGAIVSHNMNELPMDLLKTQLGVPPEAVLNNSIQSLEFSIASAIKRLINKTKPDIAFLKGHGELGREFIADITEALTKDYRLNEVEILGNPKSLIENFGTDSMQPKYATIIIAKPEKVFTEADKYVIDQYIMIGGKILWLIDPVDASMDSLKNNQSIMAISKYLNLDDQLFTYGVRLKNNLIMDLNSRKIPLRTGQVGTQAKIDFFPWFYFPAIGPQSNHPIVKNLNSISTEFVSSIDPLSKSGIVKTILLSSSNYSRTINTPAIISFDILQSEPDPRFFNQGSQSIAVLLEGEFESVFKNRFSPLSNEFQNSKFLENSVSTQMIVITDGDLIKNQLHRTQFYPLPLGYDQYTGQTYGNKDFILNAMNYLTDGKGLISLRNRELKLRLLDKAKITKDRIYWQLLNSLVPIMLVILFGIILFMIRRKKYAG
ncbi:MAG: gliding motility-associated ABC transporter substrate-binding protein GldG [Bacteroidetes bacterium HGW-Bacteroidetes-17]|nr:MAG: gliding motility-associated ABC transporter substrate-binding protein GldG [Bacteroidetes bacterium HGW-Bacteroidetes-17]